MPTYETNIPGLGKFQIESDSELTDEQVVNAAMSQQGGSAPAATTPQVPDISAGSNPKEIDPNYPTDQNFWNDPTGVMPFLSRMGRITNEAAKSAMDIPKNALNVVTGNDPEGRVMSALKTLGGVFSPLSVATSPVRAAVEEGAAGVGASPKAQELTGIAGELAGTLGLGMLAKSGSLGEVGLDLAKFLGVGRVDTIEEAVKHDPHLRFILSREDGTLRPASEAEQLARQQGMSIKDIRERIAASASMDPSEETIASLIKKGFGSEVGAVGKLDEGQAATEAEARVARGELLRRLTEQAQATGRSIAQVADELGISKSMIGELSKEQLIGGNEFGKKPAFFQVNSDGTLRFQGRTATEDANIVIDPVSGSVKSIGEVDPNALIKAQPAISNMIGDLAREANVTLQPGELTERLARQTRSPILASAALDQKAAAYDEWMNFARSNGEVVDQLPPAPTYKASDMVEFMKPGSDMTMLGTLGTPATRAAAIHPDGAKVAYEMQLASVNLKKAIDARKGRVMSALGGLNDSELRQVMTLRESDKSLAEHLADDTIPQNVKAGLQFLEDKFQTDRDIIVPRLRDVWRPRVERDIRKALNTLDTMGVKPDEATVKAAAEAKLNSIIPDNWGLDQYITHIFPGFYKVTDAKGKVLGTANTKLEAKFMIRDLVEGGEYGSKDLKVNSTTYFDSELLRMFKGRVERSAKSLAEGASLSDDEIAAASEGNFGLTKRYKFFGQLLERRGKSTGYSRDLMTVMDTYDRGLERWMQLSDLGNQVSPTIRELGARGYPNLAWMLEGTLKEMWGYRNPVGSLFDAFLQTVPGVKDIVAPYALERWTQGIKGGFVNVFLKYNPRFHAVNSTQTITTLWPIADATDIASGVKLLRSNEGAAILERHGVREIGTKVGASLGAPEKFNQETAFLTMYNKGRQYGLTDQQAADYATIRGNIYSQFLGTSADQPIAFRKLDPTGLATMFQRFPVKQLEMGLDLIKDRNFPGAAKWLGSVLLLGGMRAATFGAGGWLSYKMYKQIESEFGTSTADVVNVGLPALAGVDLSNSMMIYNPPLGTDNKWWNTLGILAGPVGSLMGSAIGAAVNTSAPEPSSAKRAFDAVVNRVPFAKELDGVRRLMEGDYELKDPLGRLRYKADVKDLFKQSLGFRNLKDSSLDLFANALVDVRDKRDGVLDYAASRYGQASLAGVDLPNELRDAIQNDVDAWNSMWPEFPISGTDILTRAQSRREAAVTGLRERLLKGAPKVLRQSGTFSTPTGDLMDQVPPPGLPDGGG